MMTKMWVARDKDSSLFMYNNKPWRQTIDGMWIDNDGMYVDWKDETMYLEQLSIDLFPDLKWEDEPVEAIIDTKTSLIKRFEILNTMYQNTNPDSINHMSFNEYALKYWDAVDMNNNVETAK